MHFGLCLSQDYNLIKTILFSPFFFAICRCRCFMCFLLQILLLLYALDFELWIPFLINLHLYFLFFTVLFIVYFDFSYLVRPSSTKYSIFLESFKCRMPFMLRATISIFKCCNMRITKTQLMFSSCDVLSPSSQLNNGR